MPRATGQPEFKDTIKALKRSELQALAKTYGVKANGKNQVIIEALLANKSFVDSRKETIAESSKSPVSVQFSPNTTEARAQQNKAPAAVRQGAVEDVPVPENIPLDVEAERNRIRLLPPQEMMKLRRSLAAMSEEQVLLQQVVDKLRILNEETRSILDEKVESLKKMIWTRQILEQLCAEQPAIE